MMGEICKNVLPNGKEKTTNVIFHSNFHLIFVISFRYFSDNLRELCNTFRHLLYELAKCVSVCEHDLNASLVEQLNKFEIIQSSDGVATAKTSHPTSPVPFEISDLNLSLASSVGGSPSKRPVRVAVVPDVSGILSLIEDPSLVNFVTEAQEAEVELDTTAAFNLNTCLEKLKIEADSLLHLSEKLVSKRGQDNRDVDGNVTLEEEDGLKSKKSSLNESFTAKNESKFDAKPRLSLPLSLPIGERRNGGSHSELNEVKNQLVKAEERRKELEKELTESIEEQNRLGEELRLTTMKLNRLLDGQSSEDISEG